MSRTSLLKPAPLHFLSPAGFSMMKETLVQTSHTENWLSVERLDHGASHGRVGWQKDYIMFEWGMESAGRC